MRTQEEFERFLAEELAPKIRGIEAERARVAAERQAAKLPGAWKIAAVALGLLLGSATGKFDAFVIVAVAPFGVDIVRMSRVRDTATPRVRAELLEAVVTFWDPSFRYEPRGTISREEFDASRLFQGESCDSYAGEDLVLGRHGATVFRFCQLAVQQRKRRRGKTRTEDVFRGIFFAADFNKEFRGETLVVPDTAERHLGMVGRALQAAASGGRLRLVELEDPEFERAFVVRSSDPIEARYLLSPSLMRRILAFHQNTGSQLRLSFTRGHVYLAVPVPGDLFSVSLHAPLDAAKLRAWAGELLFATSIVDEFDLNTRIWSKAPAA